MSRQRKVRFEPGTIRHRNGISEILGEDGVWELAPEPAPYVPPTAEELAAPPKPDFSHLSDISRRNDMTVHPRHRLTVEEMEHLGEETWRRAARYDGWTAERKRSFIETLAATASISEAARHVGLSRQSAHKLYRRDPLFRAAWDEALQAATNVLAAAALDRAINGYEEEVWHNGQVVGTRTRYSDRLLPYLLRVLDPMRFAPIDEVDRWQRHRGPRGALDAQGDGVDRALDRLEAAAQEQPFLPDARETDAPYLLEKQSEHDAPADADAAAENLDTGDRDTPADADLLEKGQTLDPVTFVNNSARPARRGGLPGAPHGRCVSHGSPAKLRPRG